MHRSIPFRCALALPVLALLAAAPAAADYLRWASAEIQARTTDGCFVLAETTMKGLGFQGVRYGGTEVTGQNGPVFMAVTCIATRPRPTAVVMAIGANDAYVTAARDNVVGRLRAYRGDPRDPL